MKKKTQLLCSQTHIHNVALLMWLHFTPLSPNPGYHTLIVSDPSMSKSVPMSFLDVKNFVQGFQENVH